MNAGTNGVPHRSPRTGSGPTADEIAAVLAALTRRGPAPKASTYECWRRTRLASLHDRGWT
jgi:hypothetical protein